MKYVKEIVIIFGITMVGELLNKFIPLPVPAGVYGLFILLGGLCSGIIKLSDVEVTGNLLLDLMPVMFIPAAVGIIASTPQLNPFQARAKSRRQPEATSGAASCATCRLRDNLHRRRS